MTSQQEIAKFCELAERITALLERETPIEDCFPLIKQVEPLLTTIFGKPNKYPDVYTRCEITRLEDPDGMMNYLWLLNVSLPGLDYARRAVFKSAELKAADKQKELAKVVCDTLFFWLQEARKKRSKSELSADTKTDTEKKPRKKRPLPASAAVCGAFIKKSLSIDPTISRRQLIIDWIDENGGKFEGKPLSLSSIERALQEHSEFWKPDK